VELFHGKSSPYLKQKNTDYQPKPCILNKAAFSALSEINRILGENGMRNTLRSNSALDDMFTDSLRNINKGDHVVREVNGFIGSIGDEYLMRLFSRFDNTWILEGTHTSGLLIKTEIISSRAGQIMAKAPYSLQLIKHSAYSHSQALLMNYMVIWLRVPCT